MDVADIEIAQYDYDLPQELIALHPLAQRDACRLLVADCRPDSLPADHIFTDLPTLLPRDTMLVCNNTRVINARLRFRKCAADGAAGALIEIFCLEPSAPADYERCFASTRSCTWVCLVGNAKKWKQGKLSMSVNVDGVDVVLNATMKGEAPGRARLVEFDWSGGVSFSQVIDAAGVIPIPPYLDRETEDTDRDDYQTVYSKPEGSVAAPTAGLHFTPRLLDELAARGLDRREVTLHVGAGTFQPVKSERIGDHPMHSEFIAVRRDTIVAIREQLVAGKPVAAVGTTSVRTLESLYQAGCMIAGGVWNGEVDQWYAYSLGHNNLTAVEALDNILRHIDGEGMSTFIPTTRLLIAPGYKYRIVSTIITNFHQPHSTLLLLIAAFLGDKWRRLYNHAVERRYRFLSYGDACLFTR